MNEDQTYRFRDIRKSEEYRRRIFLHFKDGKVAELSYIQAEAVEEARKNPGISKTLTEIFSVFCISKKAFDPLIRTMLFRSEWIEGFWLFTICVTA